MQEKYIPAANHLRAALSAARLVSAREVVLDADGIEFTDPLGGKHRRASSQPYPGHEQIMVVLNQEFRHKWNSESSIAGHGNWKFKEDGGKLVLKASKPRFAALESVFSAAPEELAKLRSLYGHPDVDIFIACEGEARARDVAVAFATELNLSGRTAKLSLAPEARYRYGYRETAEEQNGPPIFQASDAADAQAWDIFHSDEGVNMKGLGVADNGMSRIAIWTDPGMASRFFQATDEALAPSRRTTVLIGVQLEKSSPVGKIVLSAKAEAIATTDETVTNAPWTRHNERKAARDNARPKAPRTWHQTTEAVGEAFVARQAPRGYVSNKSLFFHGPVAFSVFDGNPVAAIVDIPGKETVIFCGREPGIGGTTAGTVTSACGDISRAAKAVGLREIYVGDLTSFLSLGGEPLNRIARGLRARKNEAEFPASCEIDTVKLAQYLSEQLEYADEGLKAAFKTQVPTHTKAMAYHRLARLAEFKDMMCGFLGVALPEAGDATEYDTLANDMTAKARDRQNELGKKRAEATRRENELERRYQGL